MESNSRDSIGPILIDELRLRQWMVDQMALIAIHGEQEIEARNLFGFQKAGTLEGIGRPAVPYTKFARLVDNPSHRRRVPSPSGPCILTRPERASGVYEVYQVAGLLMENQRGHRKIALSYFDGMADANLLTERSKRTLQECRSNLLSSDVRRWRTAAASIYDAMEEDWLLNLAGLRQALAWDFQEGMRDYLPRVLRPSLTAIDSIDLMWWHPREQREEIQQAILRIVQTAETLPHALDGYFVSCGHLPFAQDLSMGRLIAEWRSHHPDHGLSWQELCSWAENNGSLTAYYHICQAAAANPTLLGDGSLVEFWGKVTDVLDVLSENKENGMWHVRYSLARHYCQYFECLLPWNDGQRIPALAWWLGERVAALFDPTGVNSDLLQDMFFAPTHLQWHLARGRAGRSDLRLQTLFCPYVWQRALVQQLSESVSSGLDVETLEVNQRKIVETCMAFHAWQEFRHEPPPDEAREVGYAFEGSMEQAIDKWLTASAEDERRENFQAFISIFQEARKTSLPDQLSQLGEPETTPDSLTLLGLRAATYSAPLSLKPLETLMRDEGTASRILATLDEPDFWLLVDVLMESAAASETEWRVAVPHTFATASLMCEDEERRKLLFILVVNSSVATDTVSALRLLFQHQDGHKFRALALERHEWLNALMASAPQWLAARIRAVLAALDI